ncbi:MAG TPA: NfeD family protein [Bryobacteraceae bacterium]|jgi:membrane protein implicated in regulation of membrane protease activity|nr:NfeD family protein [Bryobacteraceae bacterium]
MWPEIFLICFWIGALWSLASLMLGGFHLGHSGAHGHFHGHGGQAHVGGHGHAHGPAKVGHAHASESALLGWLGVMANPSCIAVYLAWFGGIGYLLMRHTGLAFWANLVIAIAVGLFGAWLLAAFLRFLQSKEHPLDAADYEMVGTLGRVSCTIRPDGVGEVIYVRDGARRPLSARSDDGREIKRDEEVIVTRFEKGIAYVRTWDAMTSADVVEGTGRREHA